MRRLLILISIATLPGITLGQDAAPRDQARQVSVAAATDSAVHRLLIDIEAEPIAANLTVKEFLQRTHGREALLAVLARADQIGGPRWLDERTCQVRLEASGALVEAALIKLAADHPHETPVPAGDLARLLASYPSRTFAATGVSTAAIEAPPPPALSAWEHVAPETRNHALEDARRDAVRTVLASIAPVELVKGKGTVGDALKTPTVAQALGDWLSSRPVTGVDYLANDRNELQIEVTLSVAGSDLFDILRAAVTARNDIPHPSEAAGWMRVREELVQRMAPAVGHASPPAPHAVALPAQPPEWVGGMVDVEGRGENQASSLRAARAAEKDALAKLREQVMDLHVTPDETVGEAAAHDPQLAKSLDRALAQGARLYKTEYRADGTVVARMSVDLRLIWAALEDHP